ncbi:MAG: hypothetical protein KF773_42045, partial [Deltaproteobacteria bacterium]|nr:hypothetical protein [Deltaproteobacteria bacterium]
DEAAAWLAIGLVHALRGDVAWGATLDARVDAAAIPTTALPAFARPAFARLLGRAEAPEAVTDADLEGLAEVPRLVVAAGRALRGASSAEVRAALGPFADRPDGRSLLALVGSLEAAAPPKAAEDAAPGLRRSYADAVVAYVRARVPLGPPEGKLREIVEGYLRDPAVGERRADDAVARATDDAVAYAAIGTLYDALADPARSRRAWHKAFASSAEPAFAGGLAAAMARANDPDAALIYGTAAAAGSGDPAVAWTALARALLDAEKYVAALEAARGAIDLAGPDVLGDALDDALAARRALGRAAQAESLAARRGRATPPITPPRDDDPTDAVAALAAYRAGASPASADRLWTATRWNPRAVAPRAALLDALAPADPRRATIARELVALAADRDAALARTAVFALRRR